MRLLNSSTVLFATTAAIVAFLPTAVVNGQFSCAFSGAKDEGSCFEAKDKDGSTCVWCAVSSFGFCVTEAQAESIEQSIPGAECDRKGHDGSDDDDAATDDDSNSGDDGIAPTDDGIPDDFWNCLQQKDSKACHEGKGLNCTWCDTKGGFGLCMSGPAAESAKKSDWFTCDANANAFAPAAVVDDPMDSSCLLAYLQDQSEESCLASVDQDGNFCEFCTLQGFGVCLSVDQASIAEEMGVTCDDDVEVAAMTTAADVEDPLDPACLMAYLEDQSKDGCLAAQDSDGNACEWCSLQGAFDVCVNVDQAAIVEQVGATCDDDDGYYSTAAAGNVAAAAADPLDTSCLLAFLEDQTKEGCESAMDQDGNACEFCSVQGFDLCLNDEQAAIAEQAGATCDDALEDTAQDPLDTSCMLEYLEDQSKEACLATVDQDGNPCEFCSMQGAFDICLNEEQAAIAEQAGATCDATSSGAIVEDAKKDLYDKSCIAAFFVGGADTAEACTAVLDEDGNRCEWCHLEGVADICLTESQANMITQLGDWCDGGNDNDKNTAKEAAIAEKPAAPSTKESEDTTTTSGGPYDPLCFTAAIQHPNSAQEACDSALGGDGNPCVWCDAPVGGLCLSSEQAAIAGDFLDCGAPSQPM